MKKKNSKMAPAEWSKEAVQLERERLNTELKNRISDYNRQRYRNKKRPQR